MDGWMDITIADLIITYYLSLCFIIIIIIIVAVIVLYHMTFNYESDEGVGNAL